MATTPGKGLKFEFEGADVPVVVERLDLAFRDAYKRFDALAKRSTDLATAEAGLATTQAGLATAQTDIGALQGSVNNGTLQLDELSSNPSSSILDAAYLTIYVKSDKFVLTYKVGSTRHYVTLDLDGSDTSLAISTSAP